MREAWKEWIARNLKNRKKRTNKETNKKRTRLSEYKRNGEENKFKNKRLLSIDK